MIEPYSNSKFENLVSNKNLVIHIVNDVLTPSG